TISGSASVTAVDGVRALLVTGVATVALPVFVGDVAVADGTTTPLAGVAPTLMALVAAGVVAVCLVATTPLMTCGAKSALPEIEEIGRASCRESGQRSGGSGGSHEAAHEAPIE